MWSEIEKKILNEILDELIPANPAKKIPSAGQLGVASFIFEVASKTPELQDDIKLVLTWGYFQSGQDFSLSCPRN